LKKVTTPLTMNTMIAVITTGKMNLALPSMRASRAARCEPKASELSRGDEVFTMLAGDDAARPTALKTR
jgi:hypothetical protein